MVVYKDGSQIIVEDVFEHPGKVFNITSHHSRMSQSNDGLTVSVIDGLYDVGYTDLLANTVDDVATPYTLATLRAIIGS